MVQKWTLRVLYSVILRQFLRLFVGVKFRGGQLLPRQEQFIIVANHNSHLDTMALMAALPSSLIHLVRPVAAEDYFGGTPFRATLSNFFINTLLIPRHKKGKTSIARMLEGLEQGYSLIIFPEGTRGAPEKLQPFKKGVALLLKKNPEVKYVPVYMSGIGTALPKGERFLLPYSSTIQFGEARQIESDDTDTIIQNMREEILQLKQKTDKKSDK